MGNPYESPEATVAPRSESAWLRGMGYWRVVAWLYPVVLVSTFYCTWLTAWVVLGRMPRPSIDDPKSISVVVDIVYLATGLLLIGFPVGLALGIVAVFTLPGLRRRVFGTATLLLVWAASFALLRLDPLRVGDWFMD